MQKGEENAAATPPELPHGRRHNRATILAVARAMLNKRGLHGVTMEDVAREAGLTRRTIYNHFANTTDLFCVTTKAVIAELAPLVPPPLPPELPAASGMTRFAQDALRLFADARHLELHLALVRDAHDLPALTALYERQIQLPVRQVLTVYLTERRARGEFIDDPHEIASEMVTALIAVANASRLLRRPVALGSRSATHAIIEAFLAPPGPNAAIAIAA